MTLRARAFILMQQLLPQHLLTAAVYWLARRRSRWLKNALIRGFCRLFPIDLTEAEFGDAEGYADFNAFFTRALQDGRRPLSTEPNALLSPCDGTVSERGTIDGSQVLQARLSAKCHSYSLEALVGDAGRAAAVDELHRFAGAVCVWETRARRVEPAQARVGAHRRKQHVARKHLADAVVGAFQLPQVCVVRQRNHQRSQASVAHVAM